MVASSATDEIISSPNKLHGNYLRFMEVLAHSLGRMGASGSAIVFIPLVFATAGNGTWFSIAFAMAAYVPAMILINVFSRRVATPGALYIYVGLGLGPLAGAIAGWSLVIGYALWVSLNIPVLAHFILVAIDQLMGIQTDHDSFIPLIVLSVMGSALAWWYAYRDIRLSTRLTLRLEFISLSMIFLLIGGYFWHGGTVIDHAQMHMEGLTLSQFGLGLVLTMSIFTAFESTTVLGAEAKLPCNVIPRVVSATVLGVGCFLILAAYVLVAAFQGLQPALDKAEAPMTVLAQSSGIGFVGILIMLGLPLTVFSALLACLNTASRLLYSLSQHGLFHAKAGKTHRDHATPHIAIGVVMGISLVTAFTLLFCGVSAMDILGYLASIATYGYLFAYMLVAIAAPCYLRRLGKMKWWHVFLAVIAVLLLSVPLIGSVYPVPEWPYTLFPFVFIGLLALGVGYFLYLRKTDPTRLRAIEEGLLGTEVMKEAAAN